MNIGIAVDDADLNGIVAEKFGECKGEQTDE